MAFLAAVWDIWTLIFEVLGITASVVLFWRERIHRRNSKIREHHQTSPTKRDSDLVVWLCLLLFAVSATALTSRFF